MPHRTATDVKVERNGRGWPGLQVCASKNPPRNPRAGRENRRIRSWQIRYVPVGARSSGVGRGGREVPALRWLASARTVTYHPAEPGPPDLLSHCCLRRRRRPVSDQGEPVVRGRKFQPTWVCALAVGWATCCLIACDEAGPPAGSDQDAKQAPEVDGAGQVTDTSGADGAPPGTDAAAEAVADAAAEVATDPGADSDAQLADVSSGLDAEGFDTDDGLADATDTGSLDSTGEVAGSGDAKPGSDGSAAVLTGCALVADCLDPLPGCQAWSCQSGTCVAVAVGNGAPCDDGNACTLADKCSQGTCSGATAKACDDGNPCTTDGCDAKTGDCTTLPADGAPCDDGLTCSIGDQCKAGKCLPSKSFCACSLDADCPDDGNACNGTSYCDKSGVQWQCKLKAGSPVTCPVSDSLCLGNQCNPKTGECQPIAKPTRTACSDSDPCTVGDACDAGGCKPGVDTCLCKRVAIALDSKTGTCATAPSSV